MHPVKKHSIERWRRTGIVNIVLVTVCAALLIGSLVTSATRPNASIQNATIIYEADCTYTSRLNLGLHLLINLVSSGILASSNFYMQVLSSPSRKEIDRAHAYLKSLDIGIPSVKNIRFVSRFKQVCWAILLLSSFPLHLIFNSAVFETAYQGSEWNLTIATESFTQGTPYFAPGASLSPAGSPSPAYVRIYENIGFSDGYNGYGPSLNWRGYAGYGEALNLTEYWDENSYPRKMLNDTAAAARSWLRLDPETCLAEYRSCSPRKKYGDVVVIVNSSTPDVAGWTRSEVFNFDPQSNLSSLWDSHIPPNDTNSLWYSTQCETMRSTRLEDYSFCEHSCLRLLGINATTNKYDVSSKSPSDSKWSILFHPTVLNITEAKQAALGYNDTFNNLDVNYCLARPMNNCKIGVANSLILIVLFSIVVKILTCIVVIRTLNHMSLVTPGDAMESFISQPDLRTEGLGTFDIADSERLEFAPRTVLISNFGTDLTQIIRPRRWQTKPRRLISIIPRAAWTRTYCLLLCAIIFIIVCLSFALEGDVNPLAYSFGHSDDNLTTNLATSYLGSLLAANAPQLILSLCYFSYNTFFTRLAVETEWNSFSMKHQPLRVSYPIGKQIAKYRLQLPYKYSMPLLAISILLHWLVSNTIYVFVTEGGYWEITNEVEAGNHFGVSDDAVVALGYSPPAILVLFIVSVVLSIFPAIWSLRKVKGDMVSGGTNSLVISAACHAVVPSEKKRGSTSHNDDGRGSSETSNPKTTNGLGTYERLENPLITEENEDHETQALRALSRSEIKWGAMPLPTGLASKIMVENGQVVKHLSFGGLEDDVQKPEDGDFYV